MSKHEIIIQMLKGIEQMLTQQTLLHKDVLNSSEAALYMGRSVNAVYKLRSRHKLPSYKPSNGKLYFNRVELFDWMMSDSPAMTPGNRKELNAPEEPTDAVGVTAEEEDSSDEEEEEAKMAIFHQEGG